MSDVPPLLAVLIVAFVGAIVGGRWLLVNESVADRLINRALSWDIGAVLGYGLLAGIGYPEIGQRLFMGIGFLALSNSFGLVVVLDGADPATAWRRQRRYDSLAVLAGVFVLLCTVMDAVGLRYPQGVLDWDAVLWTGIQLCIAWVALLLVRAAVRELRTAGATIREKLTYAALLTVGCYGVASASWRALAIVFGAPPNDPGTAWAIGSFVTWAILATLISFPLVNAVLVLAGLDRASRCCRRLRPLWQDLTAAVPEVVLPFEAIDRPGSAARLYRMTVEIRDALLHLKQFLPDSVVVQTGDLSAYRLSDYATDIAEAARLKQHGAPPAFPRAAVQLPVEDRTTELRSLLALSRRWSAARAAVTSRTAA